jgi:hypothetical protein
MRTTVNLDDDVAAAVEHLRREQQLGLSEAVNTLARAGLTPLPLRARRGSRFQPAALGMRVDLSNVAEVLDQLDDDGAPRS